MTMLSLTVETVWNIVSYFLFLCWATQYSTFFWLYILRSFQAELKWPYEVSNIESWWVLYKANHPLYLSLLPKTHTVISVSVFHKCPLNKSYQLLGVLKLLINITLISLLLINLITLITLYFLFSILALVSLYNYFCFVHVLYINGDILFLFFTFWFISLCINILLYPECNEWWYCFYFYITCSI